MSNRAWLMAAALSVLSLAPGCSCAGGDGMREDGGPFADGATGDAARDAGDSGRRDGGDSGHVDGAMLPDGSMLPDGAMLPDGSMLPDGAMLLDGATMHDGGACTTTADCEDGFSCTVDTCVGGSCQRTIDASACTDDGLYCNGGSACAPTSSSANATTGCAPTPAPDCDDHVGCTMDACDEAADACTNTTDATFCDDHTFCNGAERCAPGIAGADAVTGCAMGTAPTCDDGVACTTDACDASSDACVSTPSDSVCNDGLVCDGVEHCAPASVTADARGCVAGTSPSCDDGIACTLDDCSESGGGCVHAANDSFCADGVFCDGIERCAPGAGADARGCVLGTSVRCAPDAFDCTVESCSEAASACISTPSSSSCAPGTICTAASGDPATGCTPGRACSTSSDCDDHDVCNGAERCVGATPGVPDSGVCAAGTNLACADSVGCTVDACDPVLGCRHTASDAACDDHLVCNGIETCNATSGCTPGAAPTCNDNLGCTFDSCSESAGGCVYEPHDSICSNGAFCDGVERCVAGVGCQPGAPPSCDDGVACTVDTCSAATDACGHVVANARCDDGQFCDGTETCDAMLGCLPGTPINCNDGLACSNDVCVEATDACDHVYDASNCASGQVCTASGCQAGRSCTGPTAGVCDDGQFCNGQETCSSSTSVPGTCRAGTVVSCNDGLACTTDVCSNAMSVCTYAPWDRDGDGFTDASCGGLGTDCNDTDPAIHPGAAETCDGVDRNCDGTPNNGELANGASCTSPLMCCNGACNASICTLPSTTCHRTAALCTTSADCCSGRCSLGVDGQHRCQVVGGCDIAGETCATAADCCSTGCVGGVCSDSATCHITGATCTSNAQCCSNICTSGTCRSAGSGCQVDGETCSSAGNCCSGFCTNGRCSTHDTCRAEGEICTTGADCCTGGCDSTTHRCEALGSCSSSGEPCTGQRDCCSALCADAGSGVRICQHLDGCRPFGETCLANADCCSNECSAPDSVGVRRCVNPPGCVDAGEICAQGGSNDCCVLRTRGCVDTGLGVSRCNDQSMCIALGGTCEFGAQCCNGADCLLDAMGVRRCSTMCIAEGHACLSDADCCEGICLDGSCNPSSSGCTPLFEACTSGSDCCSLHCDGICFP